LNVRPYSLLNKRGDRKYGYVHVLAPDSINRSTLCGKTTETPLGYWEETDEPVTCPLCSREPRIVARPIKTRPITIEEYSGNLRPIYRLKGVQIKRLKA